MVTKEDIRSQLINFTPKYEEMRPNLCHHYAPVAEAELQDLGLSANLIQSNISTPKGSNGHMFVIVPGSEIEDCNTSEPVVIDISLTQFCTENLPEISFAIDEHENIPKVAIFAPSDKEYNWYNF